MIDVTPKLKALKVSAANISKYASELNRQMEIAGINTEKRINAFLAQILHESGNLTATLENMNFTAGQLKNLWPTYFKNVDPNEYAHQPEKIGNYVYGKRMGNKAPNDGYKYRGRGIIGNTGKSQYEALKKATGVDFVSKPELLEQPKYAIMAAVKYWVDHGLNAKADKGDFQSITKSINGGTIGKEDRDLKFRILSGLTTGVDIAKKNPFSTTVLFLILFSIFAYAITRVNKS